MDRLLTESDLPLILEELSGVHGKWSIIGISLGIPEDVRRRISAQLLYRDPRARQVLPEVPISAISIRNEEDALREIIRLWIRNWEQYSIPLRPTWENLIRILRGGGVGEDILSLHLKTKYGYKHVYASRVSGLPQILTSGQADPTDLPAPPSAIPQLRRQPRGASRLSYLLWRQPFRDRNPKTFAAVERSLTAPTPLLLPPPLAPHPASPPIHPPVTSRSQSGTEPSPSSPLTVNCPECGRTFKNNRGLSSHMRVHNRRSSSSRQSGDSLQKDTESKEPMRKKRKAGSNLESATVRTAEKTSDNLPPVHDPQGSLGTRTHRRAHRDDLRGLNYEPDNIHLLRTVAVELPTKWRQVGLELGIEKHDLDRIEKEKNGETFRCYEEVFDLWKRRNSEDKPYTWATLIQALRSPLVDGHSLADTLKREFAKKN